MLRQHPWGKLTPMTQNRIVCFRLDEQIDHRIACVLGSRYSTRSRFIRTAIEQLLLREEGQARLRAAQTIIQWG
jgi:Arc/MetJ-type ribon-helix-helix transcriptional regulator